MNIDQPLVGSNCHYQKSLSFIPALERCTADRRHEDGFAVFPVDEVGLCLVTFTLPLKPLISKTIRTSMLPEGLKHPTGGCGLNPGINQRWLIPPPGRVSPVDRIEMQLFIALAQQQHACTWYDVVSPDRFRVKGDIPLSLFRKIG